MSSKLKLVNLWIVISLLILVITCGNAEDVVSKRSVKLICADEGGTCVAFCHPQWQKTASDCRRGQMCCLLN